MPRPALLRPLFPLRSLVLACLLVAASSVARAASASTPNIVFIFSDDHAYQALSAYGDARKLLDTPNIDRIAKQGMRFDRCLVPNSICGPSRATVLTGTYNHINGFYNNSGSIRFDSSQTTFPKILQKAGYQTAIIGKWHLGSDPTGFDFWQILPGQGVYYNPPMIRMGETIQNAGYVTDIITDPANLAAAATQPLQILVLGGGENRSLDIPPGSNVIDMEQIDPDAVELPGWYRPNPSYARDVAFVVFSAIGGGALEPKQITNYRWALSAFGTASAAALNRNDTVYCLTPLHHPSGLLVSLGGAVVAGSRIALSRGLNPKRFLEEVRQYGVSVVTYTWAMLGEVIDDPDFSLSGNNPIRLFMGSGMPTGLWDRILDIFGPAKIVEFFATSDGQAVLANVAGMKVGSEGRPLPGGGEVQLCAYDADEDLILENDRGFVRIAGREEIGVLLAKPWGPIDPTASIKRGVFAAGDIWISTEYVFWRDNDGDFWLLGNRSGLIRTARGVVFPSPITDAIGGITAVDLAVTYPLEVDGGTLVAVTAFTLRPGMTATAADISEAVRAMPVGLAPDVVHVVPELPLSASYRPTVSPLKAAGLPRPGRNAWYLDPDTGRYKTLTAAVRATFVSEDS